MAQVTITPENSSWTSTAGAQTGTVEGVTVAVTNGVTGSTTAEGATMRIYKDATLTISSASNITKIVFNCVANNTTKYGPGCFGAQEGYSYDAKVGTWEGSATSVSFTASSAQVRATSIVVTLAEGGDTPVDPGDEPVAEWAEITFTKATAAGVFNDTVFTVEGSEFSLKCVDTDGKLKTTANNASFGTVEDRHDYEFRLQTVGKSSSKNNMELNIPADGQLRFAVRTATASDETRTVVLVQGTDTIYNKVAVDKDTVEGASNPRIFNFAYVNVKAGKVAVSYPVNGVNFYSFAFKAGAAEEPVLADTLTCAQAAELAAAGKTDEVIVKGYVTEIAYAWASGSMSFWMADTKDGGKVFEAYKCAIAKAEDAVIVGDLVAAKGNLTYYPKTSTPELAAGCTVEILEAVERPVVEPAQNLGAKTIAEFLALKNTKDTCVLTGVVANITNTTYGNFDLCDATDTVYIYGLLTPAGESQKFADLNVAEKDTLTVLAIYNEFNGKPQAKNAIFVEVKKYVEPVAEHTYTIAGSSEAVFGTAWDPTNAANDMTLAEGIYKWEKKDIALAAGSIKFKVCEDHAWDVAYPAQDYELAIAEAGKYTITITFEPANENKVSATATKTADIVVLPNIVLHGNFTGTWADTDPFVAAQDSLTASLTLALAAGNYEFGFKFDGTWKANGANLTREDNTANLSTGEGNMHITADVPGNYVFTYTYETQGVVVTYPEPIIVPDTIDVTMSSLTAPGSLIWDDEVATDGWWQIMGGNDTCAFSLSNGNEITTAAGTYTVDDLDAKYSYLTIVKANDTIEVAFVDGSITVAVDEVGVVTVVGALLGNDGNVYKFNLTYVEPKAETTVNVNIAEGKMNDVYADYGLYGVYGTDTTANVFVQLAIWAEDGFQGNFTEKDLDFKYVGSGIVEGLTAPKIYTAAITVTPGNLEGEYSITADLLCYNNTLYKVTMTISAAQGIDAVEAATKAIKSLQNGILTIEKAGKTYNVNGTLIR